MSVTLDVSPRELAPVAPSERIATLDILRGFGLFGVLWSNLIEQFGTHDWYDTLYGTLTPAAFREWRWPVSAHLTTWDGALAWTQAWLLHGRFWTSTGFSLRRWVRHAARARREAGRRRTEDVLPARSGVVRVWSGQRYA